MLQRSTLCVPVPSKGAPISTNRPVRTAAILLLLAAACQGSNPTPPSARTTLDRPNFVLIDIDSMRADLLHAQHEGSPLAPALSTLAAQSATFDNMFSQGSWTLPALSSLLTGRYPMAFRTSNPRMTRLDSLDQTLPSILAAHGYHGAVAWGDTVSAHIPALSEGFEHLLDSGPRGDELPVSEYLRALPEEPFFLLVHDMDLHRPSPPPKPDIVQRHALGRPTPACVSLNQVHKRTRDTKGEDLARAHTVACYRAALDSYDRVVRSILDDLERTGLRERTVVVVTSNHGNELFEHGELGHAELQYDTVLHVPLLISDPALEAPLVLDPVVQTIDVAPTILARAGIEPPHGSDGASLLPLLGLAEGVYEPRDVFSYATTSTGALRTQRYKLTIEPGPAGPLARLYDLEADPAEQRDVTEEQPTIAAELEARLQVFLEARGDQGGPAHPPPHPKLERELKERGYWEMVEER